MNKREKKGMVLTVLSLVALALVIRVGVKEINKSIYQDNMWNYRVKGGFNHEFVNSMCDFLGIEEDDLTLERLKEIERLELKGKGIKEIPFALNYMENLKVLILDDNDIIDINKDIEEIILNLDVFSIKNNNLIRVSEEIKSRYEDSGGLDFNILDMDRQYELDLGEINIEDSKSKMEHEIKNLIMGELTRPIPEPFKISTKVEGNKVNAWIQAQTSNLKNDRSVLDKVTGNFKENYEFVIDVILSEKTYVKKFEENPKYPGKWKFEHIWSNEFSKNSGITEREDYNKTNPTEQDIEEKDKEEDFTEEKAIPDKMDNERSIPNSENKKEIVITSVTLEKLTNRVRATPQLNMNIDNPEYSLDRINWVDEVILREPGEYRIWARDKDSKHKRSNPIVFEVKPVDLGIFKEPNIVLLHPDQIKIDTGEKSMEMEASINGGDWKTQKTGEIINIGDLDSTLETVKITVRYRDREGNYSREYYKEIKIEVEEEDESVPNSEDFEIQDDINEDENIADERHK